MLTLDKWFFKYSVKPIFLLVSFLWLFLFLLLCKSYLDSRSSSETSVNQFKSNLSLAMMQKNRVQIEVILSTLKKLDGVDQVALCSGSQLMMGRGLQSNICLKSGFFSQNLNLPGSSNLYLKVFYINPLTSVLFISLLGTFLIAGLGTSFILMRFRDRFETDLLQVLKNIETSKSNVKIEELRQIASSLEETQNVKIAFEKQKAMNQISKQVSHDIRSPLSALNYLVDSQKNIQLDDLVLIKKSLKRINDIANDLLTESRAKPAAENDNIETMVLSDFLKELISEKTIEYKNSDLINIDLSLESVAVDKKSRFNKKELARVISNLVNNSIEAMGSKGHVKVELSFHGNKNIIRIQDTGGGMPSSLLATIGQKEVSTKASGNGLGIFHAVQSIKSQGGDISFCNKENGLEVTISIDAISESSADVVLVDNDELCRIMWERKAKNKGIKILTCSSPDQFTKIKNVLGPQTAIYLDSDLGNGLKGEDFALELHNEGFSNLFMATGYGKEKFSNYDFLSGVISKTPPF